MEALTPNELRDLLRRYGVDRELLKSFVAHKIDGQAFLAADDDRLRELGVQRRFHLAQIQRLQARAAEHFDALATHMPSAQAAVAEGLDGFFKAQGEKAADKVGKGAQITNSYSDNPGLLYQALAKKYAQAEAELRRLFAPWVTWHEDEAARAKNAAAALHGFVQAVLGPHEDVLDRNPVFAELWSSPADEVLRSFSDNPQRLVTYFQGWFPEENFGFLDAWADAAPVLRRPRTTPAPTASNPPSSRSPSARGSNSKTPTPMARSATPQSPSAAGSPVSHRPSGSVRFSEPSMRSLAAMPTPTGGGGCGTTADGGCLFECDAAAVTRVMAAAADPDARRRRNQDFLQNQIANKFDRGTGSPGKKRGDAGEVKYSPPRRRPIERGYMYYPRPTPSEPQTYRTRPVSVSPAGGEGDAYTAEERSPATRTTTPKRPHDTPHQRAGTDDCEARLAAMERHLSDIRRVIAGRDGGATLDASTATMPQVVRDGGKDTRTESGPRDIAPDAPPGDGSEGEETGMTSTAPEGDAAPGEEKAEEPTVTEVDPTPTDGASGDGNAPNASNVDDNSEGGGEAKGSKEVGSNDAAPPTDAGLLNAIAALRAEVAGMKEQLRGGDGSGSAEQPTTRTRPPHPDDTSLKSNLSADIQQRARDAAARDSLESTRRQRQEVLGRPTSPDGWPQLGATPDCSTGRDGDASASSAAAAPDPASDMAALLGHYRRQRADGQRGRRYGRDRDEHAPHALDPAALPAANGAPVAAAPAPGPYYHDAMAETGPRGGGGLTQQTSPRDAQGDGGSPYSEAAASTAAGPPAPDVLAPTHAAYPVTSPRSFPLPGAAGGAAAPTPHAHGAGSGSGGLSTLSAACGEQLLKLLGAFHEGRGGCADGRDGGGARTGTPGTRGVRRLESVSDADGYEVSRESSLRTAVPSPSPASARIPQARVRDRHGERDEPTMRSASHAAPVSPRRAVPATTPSHASPLDGGSVGGPTPLHTAPAASSTPARGYTGLRDTGADEDAMVPYYYPPVAPYPHTPPTDDRRGHHGHGGRTPGASAARHHGQSGNGNGDGDGAGHARACPPPSLWEDRRFGDTGGGDGEGRGATTASPAPRVRPGFSSSAVRSQTDRPGAEGGGGGPPVAVGATLPSGVPPISVVSGAGSSRGSVPPPQARASSRSCNYHKSPGAFQPQPQPQLQHRGAGSSSAGRAPSHAGVARSQTHVGPPTGGDSGSLLNRLARFDERLRTTGTRTVGGPLSPETQGVRPRAAHAHTHSPHAESYAQRSHTQQHHYPRGHPAGGAGAGGSGGCSPYQNVSPPPAAVPRAGAALSSSLASATPLKAAPFLARPEYDWYPDGGRRSATQSAGQGRGQGAFPRARSTSRGAPRGASRSQRAALLDELAAVGARDRHPAPVLRDVAAGQPAMHSLSL